MALSNTRGYATARYALELDSQIAGLLTDFEGGDATADVIPEKPDPGGIVHKHIAGVKYEDITVRFGADMSDAVYDWIAAMLGQTDRPKNGAIVALDANFRATSRLNFFNARLREITFPALDAGSQEPGVIEVKLAPEFTRFMKASDPISAIERKSQKWLLSNFSLQIDGPNQGGVVRIDALTISRALASDAAVSVLKETRPGALNIPNVVFTVAESDADWLRAWHTDFVINGNNLTGSEKSGTLQFLQPNLKDALFTLALRNLGIFKLAPEKVGGQAPPRLRAEMYCEQIDFQYAHAPAESVQTGDTGSSGQSPGPSPDAPTTGGKPPLRGNFAGGLAAALSSNSATAPQIPPPPPGPAINARDPGRPLKFRT
jgi:hypothetical protein